MVTEQVGGYKRLLQLLLLVGLSILLVACETVQFYGQAVRGQLAIIFKREDIQRLLTEPDLEPGLAASFGEVLQIREFAEMQLGLPVANNYSSYVDVEREHVVWNVFAAPEFSTDPLTWCFPIAGCVAYRGYFSEQAAVDFASNLASEGFDVYTGGVDAYSTLGWFDDSLLSTVLRRDGYQLAGLIFHELAHQLVYVSGDTTFNESFATTVEREGVRRWLQSTGQAELIAQAALDQQRQQDFVLLVTDYRDRLDELYGRDYAASDMRAAKEQLQQQLRSAYRQLKQDWGGYAGYDGWFSRSLNNAQLSTVASYNDLVPYFSRLLQSADGNMNAFYSEVRVLAEMEVAERDAQLADYR